MTDWLRLLAMIFYAPFRGMREVRDRGALAPTALFGLLANELFIGYVVWTYLKNILGFRLLFTGFSSLFQSAGSIMFAPPFRDPFNYYFDPMIPSSIDWVGMAMQRRFAAEGKPGERVAVRRPHIGEAGGPQQAVQLALQPPQCDREQRDDVRQRRA